MLKKQFATFATRVGMLLTSKSVVIFALLLTTLVDQKSQAQRIPAFGLTETSMQTRETNREVASILDGYYRSQLGGSANWETIQSIRYSGTIQFREVSGKFVAFRRKPNLMKITLTFENGIRSTSAYDGEDAWKSSPDGSDIVPVSMPEAEAHDFIREANFGNHLLYPELEGKTIELKGSSVVNNTRCYRLEVTLPNGDIIHYFLDVNDFSERQVVVQSSATGLKETTRHSDFKKVDGVSFPFTSVKESAGEVIYRAEIDDILVNQGIATWMFERSSVEHTSTREDKAQITISDPVKVENDSFGPKSSFSEIEIETVPSITDKIGVY